jgi:hypothetical protein
MEAQQQIYIAVGEVRFGRAGDRKEKMTWGAAARGVKFPHGTAQQLWSREHWQPMASAQGANQRGQERIGACTLSLPRLPMAASCAALGEEVRKEVAMCLYISLRSKVCWEFGHGAWLRPWRIARRGKRTGCYVICSTRKS